MTRKHTKRPIKDKRFKSAFEEKVWAQLPKKRSKYEAMRLSYSVDKTYIPDFIVSFPDGTQRMILEAKGYLRPEDRVKMIAVKKANPDLDIRFVFAVNNKLNARSKTTYTDWAKKNGFPSCVGKVPHHWFYPDNKVTPEQSRSWYQRNKERHTKNVEKSKLKRLYNTTPEIIEELRAQQNNCCDICQVDFDTLPTGKFDIDHNHKTGEVRGLLCWNCSGGLGNFHDDVDLLERAQLYLRKHSKNG